MINPWFPLIFGRNIKPLFLGVGTLGGVGWLAMKIATLATLDVMSRSYENKDPWLVNEKGI